MPRSTRSRPATLRPARAPEGPSAGPAVRLVFSDTRLTASRAVVLEALGGGQFRARKSDAAGTPYYVRWDAVPVCTCPDSAFARTEHLGYCKHVLAAGAARGDPEVLRQGGGFARLADGVPPRLALADAGMWLDARRPGTPGATSGAPLGDQDVAAWVLTHPEATLADLAHVPPHGSHVLQFQVALRPGFLADAACRRVFVEYAAKGYLLGMALPFADGPEARTLFHRLLDLDQTEAALGALEDAEGRVARALHPTDLLRLTKHADEDVRRRAIAAVQHVIRAQVRDDATPTAESGPDGSAPPAVRPSPAVASPGGSRRTGS